MNDYNIEHKKDNVKNYFHYFAQNAHILALIAFGVMVFPEIRAKQDSRVS
jgi:hypothetical protein